MNASITHYCQKCLAANPLGQDFCSRCGTRLMIVVEPTVSRFAAGEGNVSTGEHLLERISALENRTSRLTERLERGLDLLLRQAQNAYFDRSLLKSLISLLAEDGLVQHERLERLWNERCQKDEVDQEESDQRDGLRLRILSAFEGSDRHAFEELINEGFLLIEDKQLSRGIETLQRASEISSGNTPLFLFIGEYYFRLGKTKLARAHLTKAHDKSPDDVRISLLLGLTCADDGDLELSKRLLKRATERGGSSFAGHYGLGRLFVAENDWRKALREFKRALNTKPSPEAHYVLGCLYYQVCRDTLAVRHLRQAIEMDGDYKEAVHLLALIDARKQPQTLPAERAERGKLRNLGSARRSRARNTLNTAKVAPLFRQSRSRRLIMGTDKRLAAALREDALSVVALRGSEN